MLAAGLCACGLAIPSDPDGTLDDVSSGELRIGVSPEPGLVDSPGSDAAPTGPMVEIVQAFAESIDADAQWTVGSEETLVTMLEDGELDLLAGGFTDATPWSDRAGVTRGYSAIEGADGRMLVLLVPLGENAFLTELEAFLDREVGS